MAAARTWTAMSARVAASSGQDSEGTQDNPVSSDVAVPGWVPGGCGDDDEAAVVVAGEPHGWASDRIVSLRSRRLPDPWWRVREP
jgi:hypothetical protein